MVALAGLVKMEPLRAIVMLLSCLVMWRTYLSRLCSMLGVVALLALLSCGDDGDNGPEPPGDDTSSTTTSTTQPSSSDAEAVRPYVEDLLGEWDAAMSEILADPEPVEADPAHPHRMQLAKVFTSDSPYVEDLEVRLDNYISQDAGIRPGPSGLVQQTTFVRFTETSEDEPDFVSFVACTYNDGQDYTLSTGEDLPATVGVTQVAGEAHRVDGQWLLHRLQQLGQESHPADTPNPCPELVEPEGS